MSSDATAALLKAGELVVAAGEERFSRIKNHIGFPWSASAYCLKQGGCDWRDVDIVAIGFEGYTAIVDSVDIEVLLRSKSEIDYSNEKPRWYRWRKAGDTVTAGVRKLFGKRGRTLGEALKLELADRGFKGRIVSVDHHTAHAYSALCNCRSQTTIVITADGYGDGLSGTLSVFDGNSLKRIHAVSADNSLGVFYSAVTKFLGFKSHRHEGKVTGLAGYGDPKVHQTYFDGLFEYDSAAGDFRFKFKKRDGKYLNALISVGNLLVGRNYYPGFYFNELIRDFAAHLDPSDIADISAAAQWKFEKETIAWLDDQIEKGAETIGADVGACGMHLAGGNFANVSLNARVFEHFLPATFYVHPNMGDGGTAVGAALYCFHLHEKKGAWSGGKHEHVFLAPHMGSPVEEDKLRGTLVRKPASAMEVAKLIVEGRVVGRVVGPMEYGPRALGHRSILFSPYDRSANDYVNKRLSRNEFMPFAPILTEESATRYLDFDTRLTDAMYYMTVTCKLKPEMAAKLGAVCHVDGTARPQLVDKKIDPQMHEILSSLEQLTGDSICVNTSFNAHEEPIVSGLENAFMRLVDGSVDVVYDGEYLWEKRP